MVLGDRGTGKTQMAASVIRQHCEAKCEALYRRMMDIIIDLRASFNRSIRSDRIEPHEHDILRALSGVSLLVIDELQEQGASDYDKRTLTHIIDTRYGAERPTILIANLTVPQFAQLVGPSVLDRAKETGSVILCDWPSFRERSTT